MPVGRTTEMIEAVRKAGGKAKMTLYPGVGHNSWTAAYADAELLARLFLQKRPDTQRTNQTGE